MLGVRCLVSAGWWFGTGLLPLPQPLPAHSHPTDQPARLRPCPAALLQVSAGCRDLLQRMLVPNPQQRILLDDVIRHPW